LENIGKFIAREDLEEKTKILTENPKRMYGVAH